MRKVLLTFALLILLVAGIAAVWIFQGPKISLYLDRHGIDETSSEKITSVEYQGGGTGGTMFANRTLLFLDSVIRTKLLKELRQSCKKLLHLSISVCALF